MAGGTQSGTALTRAATSADPEASRLLQRAQHGDRNAFGEIVLRYQDRLYNAMLRMVANPDEARELTQEAFLRALAKLHAFRGDAGPYTWLFRIAMNLAISRLRDAKRHRVGSLDGEIDPAASNGRSSAEVDPAEAAELQERRQQVLAALGRIDPEHRAVLVMRDIEGFDYQQMAQALALPLGTLKSRLFRARLALREELKGYIAR